MKYTVITGASSGIGYEAALAFASRGKNLVLVARRQEELNELKLKINEMNPALMLSFEERICPSQKMFISFMKAYKLFKLKRGLTTQVLVISPQLLNKI